MAYPLLYVEGPDGRIGFDYDKGFWGGLVISAGVPVEKQKQILKFLDKSADPENFNFITWGLEGEHWNLVEGEPKLTERGEKEMSASFYSPFLQSTDVYQKVNSPFSPPAENAARRELVKEIDECAKGYQNNPINIYKVIISDVWAKQYARIKDEYDEMQVDVVTGKRSLEEFQTYIEELRSDPAMQQAFLDLRQAADECGFPAENPPVK